MCRIALGYWGDFVDVVDAVDTAGAVGFAVDTAGLVGIVGAVVVEVGRSFEVDCSAVVAAHCFVGARCCRQYRDWRQERHTAVVGWMDRRRRKG